MKKKNNEFETSRLCQPTNVTRTIQFQRQCATDQISNTVYSIQYG